MPRVGFEPTIAVFERPKTVRAADRSVVGIGRYENIYRIYIFMHSFHQKSLFTYHISENTERIQIKFGIWNLH
jgi:hypothetical protein